MARPGGWWIGRLGLQLTTAFVAVALAAVLVALLLFSLTVGRDFDRLVRDQDADLAHSVAFAAAAAYGHVGWARADLDPVKALVTSSGAGLKVRDNAGHVVRATPRYAAIARTGPTVTDAVMVRGKRVGSTTVAFDHSQNSQLVSIYTRERWQARMAAAGLAILIALIVALPLSRLITAPLDRLIWAAQARGSGDVHARVGSVRGFGKLKDLALAFDEMAETNEEQDQLRRNLVADVAHELRTPIAVLQAGHEAMLDGFTELTAEHLGSLRDEVLRLARMVDDLQRLASAEAAALQLTLIRRDLAGVAATAASSLIDTFEGASITLVERLAKVEVLCDPLRMHEVVVNLLTNAMKFTPSGGQVTLQTEESDGNGRLTVSDTGIGIPPEELPHVAERFFRGHRSAEVAGSGIGLTIVTELVDAHHGTLNIDSEQGHGTTVTVTLPLAGPIKYGQPVAQRPHNPQPGTRRRHVRIIAKTNGKPG
ncbi:MAG TPA: HAMP domain-containing sensor histidine kinase [Streptosporangiaceae bacterium]|nr:HAMP domain-containing sensor histidine kinase [Streptosporangiaceae bacterium]